MLKSRACSCWICRLDLTLRLIAFAIHRRVISNPDIFSKSDRIFHWVLFHHLFLSYNHLGTTSIQLSQSRVEIIGRGVAGIRHQCLTQVSLIERVLNAIIQDDNVNGSNPHVWSIQSILHILSFVSSFNDSAFFLNFSHHILHTVVKSSLQVASLFVIHLVSLKHALICYYLYMSVISRYNGANVCRCLRCWRRFESCSKATCLGR